MPRSTPVTAVVLLALIAGPARLAGQDPPPVVQDPPPVVQDPPPVVQDPPVAAQPPTEPELVMKPEEAPRHIDPQRLRDQIIAMEGLLTSAVKNAATAAARQMQALEPGLQLYTGVARTKGFYLDDYGAFFHVEIPGVSPSAAWLLEQMERERIERDRNAFGRGQPERAASRTLVPFDPNQAYVFAVQQKLVDAMLDYRIDLQLTDWLTVAARDGEGPLHPGQIVETPVMLLRLRASDLADYRAGRITREEVLRRVEVREF